MRKIGITGGIGSGKSRVSRLFAERGVAVYDTDAAAKRLMTEDAALVEAVRERFGEESYCNGALNRAYLAARVFSDEQERQALNALVHPAVKADFVRWTTEQRGDYVIMESALLFEAGLDELLDEVVAVMAPERLRIERVMQRDGATEGQVRSRMAAQMSDEELHRRADVVVVNIFEEDLEPMVQELDRRFRH